MIRINLLPYRDLRRRIQLIRDGIGAAVFLVIIGGLLGASYLYLQRGEERQQERVNYMQTALSQIKDKLAEVNQLKDKRADLTKKMEVIKELQNGRALPVKVLQAMGRAVPEDVKLVSLQQSDNGLSLKGEARSNNAVSSFMRRLEATDLFTDPDLKVIQNKGRSGQSIKTFEMALTLAQAAEDGSNEGGPGKGGG